MNLFATLAKIPAAKKLFQQGLVVAHGLYTLFKPELDEVWGHFSKQMASGRDPEMASAVAIEQMYRVDPKSGKHLLPGALTVDEEAGLP